MVHLRYFNFLINVITGNKLSGKAQEEEVSSQILSLNICFVVSNELLQHVSCVCFSKSVLLLFFFT